MIARVIGVSESTLKRRCKDELRLCALLANVRVAEVAYDMACSGDHPEMTRWWLRTRAGWQDPVVVIQ
jgi:AraC-like DNA-binding protein